MKRRKGMVVLCIIIGSGNTLIGEEWYRIIKISRTTLYTRYRILLPYNLDDRAW